MDTPDDTTRPLISKEIVTHVYARRWWIMAVFCFFCADQSMVWNTWGPVAESAELALGWTDFNVALTTNLANISYIILVLPICMLSDTKGLRFSMLLCSGILMLATVVRCISMEPSVVTVTAYLCAFVEGISAITPYAGPPLIAAVWFPAKERPMATAIGSFFNYFGLAMTFIIGPQLVPDPEWTGQLENFSKGDSYNETSVDLLTNTTASTASLAANNTQILTNIDSIKSGITNLLYTQAGLTIAAFLLCFIYFPARPPRPPSITASIARTDYRLALLKILHNKPLWLIVISGALPAGVLGVWIAIIDVVLKSIGVSQIDSGWMGFWHTLIGCFSGIFIAKFSDFFNRRRKLFLISLYICGAACSLWFTLVCNGTLAYNLTSLYVSCILIGVCVNGTIPLFYEISAEAAYPVGEGITGGVFTMASNLFGTVFLSLVAVPNAGTEWMNWAVMATFLVSLPLLCIFPERYSRTDIDINITGHTSVSYLSCDGTARKNNGKINSLHYSMEPSTSKGLSQRSSASDLDFSYQGYSAKQGHGRDRTRAASDSSSTGSSLVTSLNIPLIVIEYDGESHIWHGESVKHDQY